MMTNSRYFTIACLQHKKWNKIHFFNFTCLFQDEFTSNDKNVDRIMKIIGWQSALGLKNVKDDLKVFFPTYYILNRLNLLMFHVHFIFLLFKSDCDSESENKEKGDKENSLSEDFDPIIRLNSSTPRFVHINVFKSL